MHLDLISKLLFHPPPLYRQRFERSIARKALTRISNSNGRSGASSWRSRLDPEQSFLHRRRWSSRSSAAPILDHPAISFYG
jgi:hypothetical protein